MWRSHHLWRCKDFSPTESLCHFRCHQKTNQLTTKTGNKCCHIRKCMLAWMPSTFHTRKWHTWKSWTAHNMEQSMVCMVLKSLNLVRIQTSYWLEISMVQIMQIICSNSSGKKLKRWFVKYLTKCIVTQIFVDRFKHIIQIIVYQHTITSF